MKTTVVKGLPRKVGLANIIWFRRKDRLPSIHKGTIRLRGGNGPEFYPLMGGEQFLYRLYPEDQRDYIWFGGTDSKAVFLTTLKPEAFQAYLNGGETSFYEALKPPVIARAELFWGKEKTRRQGDFFVFPLPLGWHELFSEWRKNCTNKTFHVDYGSHRILRTRHELYGYLFEGNFILDGIGKLYASNYGYSDSYPRMVLGEGTLKAPDHEPIELKGPHIIAQAYLIHTPSDSD